MTRNTAPSQYLLDPCRDLSASLIRIAFQASVLACRATLFPYFKTAPKFWELNWLEIYLFLPSHYRVGAKPAVWRARAEHPGRGRKLFTGCSFQCICAVLVPYFGYEKIRPVDFGVPSELWVRKRDKRKEMKRGDSVK